MFKLIGNNFEAHFNKDLKILKEGSKLLVSDAVKRTLNNLTEENIKLKRRIQRLLNKDNKEKDSFKRFI